MSEHVNSNRTVPVRIDHRLAYQLKVEAAKKKTTIGALIEDRFEWIRIIPSLQERRKLAKEREGYGK